MRSNRMVVIALGAVAGAIAVCLLIAGSTLVLIHGFARGDDGYYSLDTERYQSSAFAITSEEIDFGADIGEGDWTPFDALGTARVRADGGSNDIFIGIAREEDVDRYLAGSAHDELTDVTFDPFEPTYRRRSGEVRPAPPGEQAFWVASASGPGRQTVTWDVEGGRWSIVVMNPDATRGISADITAGVKTGVLLPVGLGILAGALLVGASAAALLIVGLRRDGDRVPAPSPPPVTAPGVYPARLDATLDDGLSRWMWLVKWFLAIPHIVVLSFLWMAFAFLTVVAAIGILFTGRYPRAIFEFNEGVMRWTWRVTFYAFTLGTDRYPPFSLQSDAGYPADLVVAYPESLSRGYVLVKWLLAVPHYLVVSLFGTGFAWWAWNADNDRGIVASGLVGLLVTIAAVVLLFTKRYPRPIFDFVMGMLRWTFRVTAYTALMRDEYPPFRLDTGGLDPGSFPTVPPDAGPGVGGRTLVGASPELQ